MVKSLLVSLGPLPFLATLCLGAGRVGEQIKKRPFNVKSKNAHNLFTRFSMDPDCPICNSCKRNRAHCRSKVHGEPDQLPEPQAFADSTTADHKVLNKDDESRSCDRVALVIIAQFYSLVAGLRC